MLDDKTGVLKSGFFQYLLETEHKRASRYGYFFWVLTVETAPITNGEVLPTIANLVQSCLRNSDYISSKNSKRLMILLPHLDTVQNTLNVGNRILDRVANYNFSTQDHESKYSIHIGGACFPTHAADTSDLLLTVDEMLSRAKSNGGNKICLPD